MGGGGSAYSMCMPNHNVHDTSVMLAAKPHHNFFLLGGGMPLDSLEGVLCYYPKQSM